MNFSQGHAGTRVQCESCLFSYGKTPEFTKKSEIHELFVLALSLVWFAGATLERGEIFVSLLRYGECTHKGGGLYQIQGQPLNTHGDKQRSDPTIVQNPAEDSIDLW